MTRIPLGCRNDVRIVDDDVDPAEYYLVASYIPSVIIRSIPHAAVPVLFASPVYLLPNPHRVKQWRLLSLLPRTISIANTSYTSQSPIRGWSHDTLTGDPERELRNTRLEEPLVSRNPIAKGRVCSYIAVRKASAADPRIDLVGLNQTTRIHHDATFNTLLRYYILVVLNGSIRVAETTD